MSSYTVIISDMHLSARTSDLNRLFMQQLPVWQDDCNMDALYMLGDIFDVWIGDDEDNPVIRKIIRAMADFAQHKPLYAMRGNRDFLLGRRFMRDSGAVLLDEPYLAEFYGRNFILTHGDEMCTDDIKYQKFRRISRRRCRRKAFLLLPLSIRKRIAQKARSYSQQQKTADGFNAISDITEQGLQQTIEKIGMTADIIHGHTHRPNTHIHQYQGKNYRRFVLQDWRDNYGGCLKIYDDGRIVAETLTL